MHRLPDWQSRLAACLAERYQRPFAWGQQDCALLAADCVHAVTGADPAADLRGYTTAREAVRVLHRHGGLRGLAAARLGAPIAPAFAQLGDVGVVRAGKREAMAVCGGGFWLAPGRYGLVAYPLAEAVVAWGVC